MVNTGRERRRRRRWQGRSGTAWLHVSGSGSQQPRSRLGPKLRHLHSNVVCAQQLRRHQAFELAHARFQLFAAAKRPRRLILHGATAQTVYEYHHERARGPEGVEETAQAP